MSYMNPMAFLENMCSLSLRWCYPSRQLSKQPGHRDVFGGCMTFTQNFNFPKTKQHRYIAPENRPKPKKKKFHPPWQGLIFRGKKLACFDWRVSWRDRFPDISILLNPGVRCWILNMLNPRVRSWIQESDVFFDVCSIFIPVSWGCVCF